MFLHAHKYLNMWIHESINQLLQNMHKRCQRTRVASGIGLPFLAITGVSSQRAAAGDARPS